MGDVSYVWLGAMPAVDSLEGLRYAADVIEAANRRHGKHFLDPVAPLALQKEADRVEREQAEKAKRDKVIDGLASTIASHGLAAPTAIASALLDRFDITPRKGDADE